MKNLSIKTTLIIAGISIVLVILFAANLNRKIINESISNIVTSSEDMHILHDRTVKLKDIVMEIQRLSLNSILLEDDDMLMLAPQKSNQFYKICDDIISQYPKSEKKKIEDIIKIKKDYNKFLLQVLAMSAQFTEGLDYGQDKLKQTNIFVEKFIENLYKLEKDIELYTEEYNNNLIKQIFNKTLNLKVFLLSIIFSVMFIVVYLIRKKLYLPLYNLVKFAQNLKQNDDFLSKRISYSSKDEIGVLSNSLNEMLENLESSTLELETLTKNQDSVIKAQTAIANMQRDKALLANKAKSEFLANMSHEIRTPLNAIMGFIDLLKEKEDDKEKQKYLNIVSSSSKSLLDIINDILDFSKIESGKVQIENIDFDPREEFVVTKKLFQAKADEKNIQLYVNYGKLPKSLNGDILRIKQIINNLISNAVKFTKENKNIYLDIDYENGSLSVNVKDEGIGINKEYQSKIFDAFSQEDCSTTRKYGGTGLGLAISYNLVKAMKGELKLKSELGVGSEFYFSIPLEIGKEIEKTVLKNTKQILKGKILVVEDNIANQMFMKVILKKIGLTFDIASDGIEAIEIFKNNQYDAILMDENMPNMNGIEATKQILEYEKINSLKHTPIIALTANALKGDRERFLEAGMDEYMTKPLNKNKLVEILSTIIK